MPSHGFTSTFKVSVIKQPCDLETHSESCFCRSQPSDSVSWYDLVDFMVSENISLRFWNNLQDSLSVDVKSTKIWRVVRAGIRGPTHKSHTLCLKVGISLVRWARSQKYPRSSIAVVSCPNQFIERVSLFMPSMFVAPQDNSFNTVLTDSPN